jgi:hypothetical protein
MILTFSQKEFIPAIRRGKKIHTIRKDENNRWKVGMKIHFWKGNPRNPSVHPYAFQINHGETVVKSIQKIKIISFSDESDLFHCEIWVDGQMLTNAQMEELATNDGLGIYTFKKWFAPGMLDTFHGKIIHWTSKTY